MMPTVHGHLCGPHLYRFKGWFFEFGYCGPWPLRKDGELRKNAGRKFWAMFKEFQALSDEEKAKLSEGGGCVQF